MLMKGKTWGLAREISYIRPPAHSFPTLVVSEALVKKDSATGQETTHLSCLASARFALGLCDEADDLRTG